MEFDGRRKHFRYSTRDESQLLTAWSMIREANKTGDSLLLARATTISARINEQLLPKPYFKELAQFVELGGADGLVVAHSGTALALIFDPGRPDYQECLAEAKIFVAGLNPPSWFHISNRTIRQHLTVYYGARESSSQTSRVSMPV
jgi:uncharacterized protein involved in propanediol utilization